jgi:hypothetical protein
LSLFSPSSSVLLPLSEPPRVYSLSSSSSLSNRGAGISMWPSESCVRLAASAAADDDLPPYPWRSGEDSCDDDGTADTEEDDDEPDGGATVIGSRQSAQCGSGLRQDGHEVRREREPLPPPPPPEDDTIDAEVPPDDKSPSPVDDEPVKV